MFLFPGLIGMIGNTWEELCILFADFFVLVKNILFLEVLKFRCCYSSSISRWFLFFLMFAFP